MAGFLPIDGLKFVGQTKHHCGVWCRSKSTEDRRTKLIAGRRASEKLPKCSVQLMVTYQSDAMRWYFVLVCPDLNLA